VMQENLSSSPPFFGSFHIMYSRCAVVLLIAISVSDAHDDVEALHLLQTSSAKISLHSDKECKAGMRAERDAKKNMKADRAAIKAARAALKAAQQAMKGHEDDRAAAQAQIAQSCPAPEVDNSPDEGSSNILVTSYFPPKSVGHYPDLLNRPLSNAMKLAYGIEKIVPGGGLPEGRGTAMGSKIGVATMQPCSVAWTVGSVIEPSNGFGKANVGNMNGVVTHYPELFMQQANIASPQKCREWADTKMKWPDAFAVEFRGNIHGSPGVCKVFKTTDIPFERMGPALQLGYSQNIMYSCYLGNPQIWKQRLDASLAQGQIVDRCGKTSLWTFGDFFRQNALPNDPVFSTFITPVYVGKLATPDPLSGTEGGRKLCLKWVKGNAKCDDAIGIYLGNNECYCVLSTPYTVGRNKPRPPTAEVPSNGFGKEICLLK